MGLLDFFRLSKEPELPRQLKKPWRRGDLGEPYCSSACQKKAGKLLEGISPEGAGRCFFCNEAVVYGSPESSGVPFVLNGSLYYLCRKCRPKWKPFTSEHGRCFVCRKPYV